MSDDAHETGAPQELPDAPLFALLRNVERDVGVPAIDRVWLFPPRRLKAGETAVVVVAAYHADPGDDRRRVLAAHYTAPVEDAPPRFALDEFGTAPDERVQRVVEEVVERLDDDSPPQPPRAFRIDGDAGRWTAMLHELAEKLLEEAAQNPHVPRPIRS